MRRTGPDTALGMGLSLAYRGLTLGLEFALPALAGFALDRRWRTAPALTLVGSALGFGIGMWHILRLSREGSTPGKSGRPPTQPG